MTVNSTSTREFTIDQLVRLAIQKAGLLPAGSSQAGVQWDSLSSQARDFLELEVDSLQAEGLMTRAVALYPVTMIVGTATYAMPSTTLAVIGDAMYAAPSSSSQTVVKAMDRAQYQLLSNKTSRGTPSLYWSESLATVTLYLWPVPDAAGTLTVQRNRLLADNNDGAKTMDLERYWAKYLVNSVAHEVAQAGGIEPAKLGYIRSERDALLTRAKAQAANSTPGQVVSSHGSGWNR